MQFTYHVKRIVLKPSSEITNSIWPFFVGEPRLELRQEGRRRRVHQGLELDQRAHGVGA